MARDTIKSGYKGKDLGYLVERLAATGYLDSDTVPRSYGGKLEKATIYFQQTHIGEDGRPLSADGIIGAKTWWALAHAKGTAQSNRLTTDKGAPGRLNEERQKILDVAMGEHARGVRERPMGSNRGKEVDKYLPDWCKKPGQKGPAWCCFFYSWVMKEALGSYPLGRRHGSCKKAAQAAQEKGLWVPAGDGTPQPGDAFVFLHEGGTGHIGLVYRVNRAGTEFNTLEGNCANRVKLGRRRMDARDLAGFIRNAPESPDFVRGLVQAQDVGASGTR